MLKGPPRETVAVWLQQERPIDLPGRAQLVAKAFEGHSRHSTSVLQLRLLAAKDWLE